MVCSLFHTLAESPPAGDVLPCWNEDYPGTQGAENNANAMETGNTVYEPVTECGNKLSNSPDVS